MLGLCEGWLLGMSLRLEVPDGTDGTDDGVPEPLGTILGCDDGIPLALGLCDGADVVDGELVETAGLYNSVSRYSLSGGKFEYIGKTLSISLVVALIPNHSAVPSHMASHE